MENKKISSNFLQFFIIFLTSFIWWIFFSYYIGNSADFQLLKSDNNIKALEFLQDDELDLTKFWEVYNIIKKHNYDVDWINKDKLIDGAIKWMVDGLWDKFSSYMTPDETKKFNDVLSWDFEWIWAVVEKNELWVLVERIIKWSPAKKSWLRSKDIIIKANDEKLEWLGLYEAVAKIKWPAWSKVVLDVLRSWEKEILKIEIIRQKIKIPSVDSKDIENSNIWYISINMFWQDTAIEFMRALSKFDKKDWIIVDLRDNWWWYLQSAVSILSNFVEKDETLVVTKYKDLFSNISYPSINDWYIYKWKIVILINENSASASEITAWALKDYKKAILVWKKSYWKWSVQKPFDLDDWSMLKLTIAKWFTPEDINIDKEWINPDVEISFKEEDYKNEYDRQFEEAKKVLEIFINNKAYKLSIEKANKLFEEKE
jgi:carboxyl-terminal processing protease